MKKTCLIAGLVVVPYCLTAALSSAMAAEETTAPAETTASAAPTASSTQPDMIPVAGNWEVYLENDSLAVGQHERTDRFYTSGLRLKRTFDNLHLGKVNAGPAIADKLVNGLLKGNPYRQKSFVIGQNFYTPSDVTVAALIPNDRPYAGWLYAGFIWTGYRPTEERPDTAAERRHDRNESVELDLGVVGPLSQAEQVQKEIHNAIGSRPPKGWDNQLKNEPGLIVSYQYNRRPLFIGSTKGFGFDVTSLLGADAGNIFTQAKLGATARFGYNVPRDFHAGNLIGPSTFMALSAMEGVSTTEPTTHEAGETRQRKNPFSFYVFGGTEGRVVLRNIFLDGNTFRDSHSVRKRHFVDDLKVGAAAHLGKLRISYTFVRRSPEFKASDARQQFGSLDIGWGGSF